MNIEKLRADTLGVEHCIHLNNCGAALMPDPVLNVVKGHLDLEARMGGYESRAQEVDRINAAYQSVATLIGAQADELAFVENATVAWQQAFFAQDFKEGDRILTAEAEYAANYIAYLQMAKRTGCLIEVIPSDSSGATDPQALEAMIDDHVKLVSLTWIPTNGGLVNPAAEIGQIARAHGIPYLLDACQAVGQMPVDVEALGCDYLSATGRKFLRGPRGTGFLYVRRERLESLEPYMLDMFGAEWTKPDTYVMRPDARRFETWESAYALHLGLGAAADYAMDIGLDAIQERSFSLAAMLREELAKVQGVSLRDIGEEQCAIVTFTHESLDPAAIKAEAQSNKINITVSPRTSTLLDTRARDLPDLVRVAPHYYNTIEELETFIALMKRMAG